ncbi:hypothetical protein ACFTZB_18040 [Rhodococcus sp. NPDC057014]|uniref:hypothetical protein n=1 Tax=Rhodococcus sp. NPDC057014 TaxID=3346000 RepID=UPI0036396FA5
MPSSPAAPVLPRVLGVLTAAYSTAIIVSPRLLAKPCKLTRTDGGVPSAVATMIRAVGIRDAASGLLLALAPQGAALRGALAVRVAADLGDAVVFGLALPDTATKAKVAGFAAAWGALCAYSGRHSG